MTGIAPLLELLKLKDDQLKLKDESLKQSEESLKQSEELLKQSEELLKLKEQELKLKDESLKRAEKQREFVELITTLTENTLTKVKAVQEANPQLSFKEAVLSVLATEPL